MESKKNLTPIESGLNNSIGFMGLDINAYLPVQFPFSEEILRH